MNKLLFKNPFDIFFAKRDVVFDLLKTIAMLMVVLDHYLQRRIVGIQDTQIYNYIFLTQMPLFVFISGYYLIKPYYLVDSFKSTMSLIGKSARALLIPFFSFSVIVSVIDSSFTSNFFQLFFNRFLFPQTSLWFLWVLFWIQTIFYLSAFLSKIIFKNSEKNRLFLFTAFLFFSFAAIFFLNRLICYFDLKLISYYSIFLFAGFLFSLLSNRRSFNCVFNKPITKILLLFISVLFLFLVMFFHPKVMFDDETILNLIIRVFGSFSSITLLYIITSFLCTFKFFNMCSKLGCLSLELYYVHLLVIRLSIFNSNVTINSFLNFLNFFGLYVLLIAISLSAIFLIKTNYVSDFLFFGKIRAKQKTIN